LWQTLVIGLSITFDFRGYDSLRNQQEPEKETMFDLVHEIVGLLDALSITKVRR